MEQVYIIDFGDKIKAGYSTDVKKRVRTLELSSGVKARQIYSVDAGRSVERCLHSVLTNRLEGEFFAFPFDRAKELLDKIVSGRIFNPFSDREDEYVYPAIFHYNDDDGSYTVNFPDLECITEGKSLGNAIYMAQDALTQWVEYIIAKGRTLPPASALQSIQTQDNEFVNLVLATVKSYKAVKRTVSLPQWLDDQASAAGLSLSRILQDALKDRLNVG